MIKLGIFGDSFGDDYNLWTPDRWHDVGPSWIDYLRSTGLYEIENFCSGGTNTYFSKKLFDEHYKKYDQIIFIATFPQGRLDLHSLYPKEKLNLQFFNINCIIRAESNMEIYNTLERKIIKAVKNYYLYLHNPEYDNTLHNLWLEDIKIKFPSVVMIPAFEPSIPNLESDALINIVQKEQKYFDLTDMIPANSNFYDARKCHLCEENNLILGKKILEFLNGSPVKLNVNDFVNPSKNKDYYFRKAVW